MAVCHFNTVDCSTRQEVLPGESLLIKCLQPNSEMSGYQMHTVSSLPTKRRPCCSSWSTRSGLTSYRCRCRSSMYCSRCTMGDYLSMRHHATQSLIIADESHRTNLKVVRGNNITWYSLAVVQSTVCSKVRREPSRMVPPMCVRLPSGIKTTAG